MDLFLKDSTITYEHSFDTGRGSMCYAYQTEDKKFLTIENGNLTYYAQVDSEKISLPSYYGVNEMRRFFPDDKLDGFPQEEALERLKKITDEMGMTRLGKPEIYAVTAELAGKLRTISDKWTKDDELYYIRFPVVYNGVPITGISCVIQGTDEVFDTGSYLEAAISKSELVFIQCVGVFGDVQSQGDNIPVKISAEDALNQFRSLLAGRNYDPVTIIGCTLTYVPCAMNGRQEYTFKPAWHIKFVKEAKTPSLKHILYDANTGVAILNY